MAIFDELYKNPAAYEEGGIFYGLPTPAEAAETQRQEAAAEAAAAETQRLAEAEAAETQRLAMAADPLSYDNVLDDLMSKAYFSRNMKGSERTELEDNIKRKASLISGTANKSGMKGSEITDVLQQESTARFAYLNPEEYAAQVRSAEKNNSNPFGGVEGVDFDKVVARDSGGESLGYTTNVYRDQAANRATAQRLNNESTGFFDDASALGSLISGGVSNIFSSAPETSADSISDIVENPNLQADTYNESQLDDNWGYTRADGTVVTAYQDMIDGGGKNFGGEMFGISGGENIDYDGDGYITSEEAKIGGGLNQNFISNISNVSGATPLGSGLEPTGVANILYDYTLPGLAYKGAKSLTGNFGYEGRPDTSVSDSDVDDNVVDDNVVDDNANTSIIDSIIDTITGVFTNDVNDDVNIPFDPLTEFDPFRLINNDDDDGDDDDVKTKYQTTPVTKDIDYEYKSYTKGGGGGGFLPSYIQKYLSGTNIDEMIREFVDASGNKFLINKDGIVIDPDSVVGARIGERIELIDSGDDETIGFTVEVLDGSGRTEQFLINDLNENDDIESVISQSKESGYLAPESTIA